MDTKYYDILLVLAETSLPFDGLYERRGNIKEPVAFASCLLTLEDIGYVFPDNGRIYHITKTGREALEAEKARRKPPVAFPTISELKSGLELEIPRPLKPSYQVDGRDRFGMPIYRIVGEDE
jgi:hypothetical protein